MSESRTLGERPRRGPWEFALRSVVLPVGDRLFGQQMVKRLRYLERAQWWQPERIRATRDEALRRLVSVAHREVPFYREHLDRAGVDPRDISRAEDLTRIPVVTKALMRPRYPQDTCRETGQKTYESCSSGSTGTNFCVREDMETAGWYRASFLLALEWSGWKVGAPHLQTGMTPKRSADRRWKDRILRCHYVSAYDMSDENLDRCLDTIERHRLKHVFGYPASLYFLAMRAASVGWNAPLRSAVTWGDMLHPHYRRQIESTFRTRVFDTYGCGEGIQISAQCGHGANYHVHSLDVIVEYVDDAGQPVPVGAHGNIVLTRLHPGPMPLIRYAVGDTGSPTAEACACGRGFDVMKGIEGRNGDLILTPGGNRLIVHFFTGILEHFKDIANFQVVQTEGERLVVKMVPGSGFTDSTPDAVRRRLRENGLTDMEIDTEIVPDIPRPASSKHRFVLNETAARPSPGDGRVPTDPAPMGAAGPSPSPEA